MSSKTTTTNYYQIILILLSLADSIQNVVLIWLVYQYTNNLFAVSLVTFANYFPPFISFFTFLGIADSINPVKQFYLSNIILSLGSVIIFLLFQLKLKLSICFFIVFILQIILSCIKTFNRIFSNKFVKILFNTNEGEKIIQISGALIQISQCVGTGLGNLFILQNISIYSFILISFIYGLILYLSSLLFHNNSFLIEHITTHKNSGSIWDWNINNNNNIKKSDNVLWLKNILQNKQLLQILIISIPSSGIYQYLSNILPFLTSMRMSISTFKNTKISFSFFSFFSTLSAAIIGIMLFKNIISTQFLEKYSFIICAGLLLILSINHNFFMSLICISLCLGLLSGLIICLQTRTNQFSSYMDLGKFTILRTSIVSLAKIVFAFLSACLVNKLSLFVVFFVPFIMLLCCFLFFYFNNYLNYSEK